MQLVLLLLVLGSFACSDTVSPRDAGGGDAAEAPDATDVSDAGACTVPEYEAGGASPACTLAATYTCGQDVYEVDCECPTATCSCFKDGAKLKTLSYGGCPSCSSTSYDDGGCGFPVAAGP